MINPLGGKLLNRSPAKIVCHCLLIDINNELIFIDSGIGINDIKNPKRLGLMHYLFNLRQNLYNTAALQVQKLGYKIDDVKHIILTHMDLDHTGGLPDFPNAYVHVYQPEYQSAINPKSLMEMERYRQCHYAHSPKWVVHDAISEDSWYGLDCIKASKNLPSIAVMIPLIGHTKGHCAVAIKTQNKWLLHAGDTYYYDKQMDKKPVCTPGFKIFQYFAHGDRRSAERQLKRLWDVVNNNKEEITVFCSHDPSEFECLSLTKVI